MDYIHKILYSVMDGKFTGFDWNILQSMNNWLVLLHPYDGIILGNKEKDVL